MQRQYIPKFTTLSYLVRSTDYFQINKENKEKSRKIGINRSKMKILKIWKKIFNISGPRVPHAKNQPPRSKTVAYMQITEWRRKWRRRTHFFAITATWNRFSSMRHTSFYWPPQVQSLRKCRYFVKSHIIGPLIDEKRFLFAVIAKKWVLLLHFLRHSVICM